MPITVKRNRFGSQLATDQQASRFVERIIVEGLEIDPGNEHEILYEAQSAIRIAVGTTLGGHEDHILARIVLDSVGMEVASALLYWEQDGFGGTPTTSIITKSTTLVSRTTNMIPGTRVPFRIKDFIAFGSADNVTFNLLFPHRVVNVSTLAAGELPSEEEDDSVFHVNHAEWQGLPKGYWLISEHTTAVSKYTGYYQLKKAAMSRVIEDWSETGILRNDRGKYVGVDPAVITALNASEYEYGVIYDEEDTGVGRWGPYPMTDFESFFGF